MTAKDLIDSLGQPSSGSDYIQETYRLLKEAGVRSSSHCTPPNEAGEFGEGPGGGQGYYLARNVEPWKKFCELIGHPGDLNAAVEWMLKCREGMDGIETLWEMTKDPRLFKLTDFYPGEPPKFNRTNDGLFVTYIYGGDARKETFRKYGSHDPRVMALSIYDSLTNSNRSSRVKIKGNTVEYDDIDDYEWGNVHQCIEDLLQAGWDVEEIPLDNEDIRFRIIVHGFDRRKALGRILNR